MKCVFLIFALMATLSGCDDRAKTKAYLDRIWIEVEVAKKQAVEIAAVETFSVVESSEDSNNCSLLLESENKSKKRYKIASSNCVQYGSCLALTSGDKVGVSIKDISKEAWAHASVGEWITIKRLR